MFELAFGENVKLKGPEMFVENLFFNVPSKSLKNEGNKGARFWP